MTTVARPDPETPGTPRTPGTIEALQRQVAELRERIAVQRDQISELKIQNDLYSRSTSGRATGTSRESRAPGGSAPAISPNSAPFDPELDLDRALRALASDPDSAPYLRQLEAERDRLDRAHESAVRRIAPLDAEFCERTLAPLYSPSRTYDPWTGVPVRPFATAAFLAFEAYRRDRLATLCREFGLNPLTPKPLIDSFDPDRHEDAPIHRIAVPDDAPQLERKIVRVLQVGFARGDDVLLRARVVRYLDRL